MPNGMRVEHAAGRSGFLEGLASFLDAVGGLDDAELVAASRCRGWTVGDVVVHVHLGLQDMLLGLASPTDAEPDTDAAAYWHADLPTNDAEADAVDRIRFVRLVGAAYRRPSGAVRHLRPTAEALLAAVGRLAPGVLRFQGHVMATGDFLATWAVELAVHQLDLGREVPVPSPAPAALRMARATVESLAGARLPAAWGDDTAVLVGAGRTALTDGYRHAAGALADRLPVLG